MALQFNMFFRQLTRYTGLIILVYAILILLLPADYVLNIYWAFIPFFYLVVLVSKYALNRLSRGKGNDFTSYFISITVIRFLLYVGVMLAYALLRPDDAIVFVITFFVFYFAYTLFEITFLYRELKDR